MKRNKEQPTIRHAVALGCGVEPIYENGKVVDWRTSGETLSRARAVGKFITEHPAQFDSKAEPSLIAVSGGWPGVALPNQPKPPAGKREGIFMRDTLWTEFGIEAGIVEIGSDDTLTNGLDMAHLVAANEQFSGLEFTPDNALGLGTARTHFWRAGPIFRRAFLGEDDDPAAVQLIKAPHGGGAKRVVTDGLGTLLTAGIFAQLGTEHRNPDSLEGAAEAFSYLRHHLLEVKQVGATMMAGSGMPMPEQPFVQVARDYLASPMLPEANAQFLAQISAPTRP